MRCPERRRYLATLEASDALRSYERELVHQSEVRLRQALLEAWSADDAVAPADPEAAATLIAAIWLAAGRSLVVGQRPRVSGGADPDLSAAAVMDVADRLLREMESAANAVHRSPERPRGHRLARRGHPPRGLSPLRPGPAPAAVRGTPAW